MKKVFLVLGLLAGFSFGAVSVVIAPSEMRPGISMNMGASTVTTDYQGANALFATIPSSVSYTRPCIYNGGTTTILAAITDSSCSSLSASTWNAFIPTLQTACLDAVKAKGKICVESLTTEARTGYLLMMSW